MGEMTPVENSKDGGAAQPPLSTDSLGDMHLTFAIGEEQYGVEISIVTEIVGMQRIMTVPDVPAYIKGVINLRGKVIPLMDVRLRLGMAERKYDNRTVIIVLEVEDAPIGLIVDGVREVVEIPEANIDPAPATRSPGKAGVVRALGRIGDLVAILLDPRALVSNADLQHHQHEMVTS